MGVILLIPKKIHYCWFGHNEKPEIIKDCIRSWEKYCPDYEIIEWNESNFDVSMNPYVKEAYLFQMLNYSYQNQIHQS